jgi:hypothetical protein
MGTPPTGASASAGFVPSAPPVGPVDQHSVEDQATNAQPSASGGFEWADAGIVAAIAVGLMGMAGGTRLLAIRMRRRTA